MIVSVGQGERLRQLDRRFEASLRRHRRVVLAVMLLGAVLIATASVLTGSWRAGLGAGAGGGSLGALLLHHSRRRDPDE